MFCGFTALSAAGDAPMRLRQRSTAPVLVGHYWYSFNAVPAPRRVAPAPRTRCCVSTSQRELPAPDGHSYPVALNGHDQRRVRRSTADRFSGFRCLRAAPGHGGGRRRSMSLAASTPPRCACTGAWPNTLAGVAGSPFPMLTGPGLRRASASRSPATPALVRRATRSPTPRSLTNAIGPNRAAPTGPLWSSGPGLRRELTRGRTPSTAQLRHRYNLRRLPEAIAQSRRSLYTVNLDPYRPTCIWVELGPWAGADPGLRRSHRRGVSAPDRSGPRGRSLVAARCDRVSRSATRRCRSRARHGAPTRRAPCSSPLPGDASGPSRPSRSTNTASPTSVGSTSSGSTPPAVHHHARR